MVSLGDGKAEPEKPSEEPKKETKTEPKKTIPDSSGCGCGNLELKGSEFDGKR